MPDHDKDCKCFECMCYLMDNDLVEHNRRAGIVTKSTPPAQPEVKQEAVTDTNKILAIDFDGVIHDHKHPLPDRRMGAPIAGAKEALESLKVQGYHLIIFTVWGGSEQGKKTIGTWLQYYKIPYDEITDVKPNAKLYIDDKAIRFSDWESILNFIK